jgi:Ca2+-binding EF-hand superfamily protein
MGAFVSQLYFGSEEDYRVRKAVERELAVIAENTTYDVEELRELQAAFLAQYPTGFISPDQFVEENVEALGGPPELWTHMFALIATTPFKRRRHPASAAAAASAKRAVNAAPAAAPSAVGAPAAPSATGGRAVPPPTAAATAAASAAAPGVKGFSSLSDRLREVSSGAGGTDEVARARLRTSLVAASDMTEALELDPMVVGLSFAHVMVRLHRSTYNASEQKLKYLFKFFDVNRDGLLSRSDLETVFGWIFSVPIVQQTRLYLDLTDEQRDPRVRADETIRAWDRDGDGLLNQDDFVDVGRGDPDLLELLNALRM